MCPQASDLHAVRGSSPAALQVPEPPQTDANSPGRGERFVAAKGVRVECHERGWHVRDIRVSTVGGIQGKEDEEVRSPLEFGHAELRRPGPYG